MSAATARSALLLPASSTSAPSDRTMPDDGLTPSRTVGYTQSPSHHEAGSKVEPADTHVVRDEVRSPVGCAMTASARPSPVTSPAAKRQVVAGSGPPAPSYHVARLNADPVERKTSSRPV